MVVPSAIARPPAPEQESTTSALLQALRSELAWLSARLRFVINRDRHRREQGAPEEYRGLYVSDDEVDALTRGFSWETASPVPVDAEDRNLVLQAGDVPLDRIVRVFGLLSDERRALVIALAPHLDRAFDRVFAYVNDDITRRRPTVGVALDILAASAEDAVRLRSIFLGDAPLARHRLIHLAEDGSFGSTPLISRYLELDPHVAEVLLGLRRLDPRLHACARHLPQPDSAGRPTPLARLLMERPSMRVYAGGRWHDEKLAEIRAACASSGLAVIELRAAGVPEPGAVRDLVALALRDGRLLNAAIVVEGWDSSTDEGLIRELRAAFNAHADFPYPIVLAGRPNAPEAILDGMDLHYAVADPSHTERGQLWSAEGADGDAGRLASAFRLGQREIRGAGRMAHSIASLGGRAAPELADFQAAARLQTRPRLSALANKLTPRFTWDDIVLPHDCVEQLREILAQATHQDQVFNEWGLGEKLTLGRGIVALFAGPSGTGKTMAAELIAGELGQDMYKIDLSGLVSKYIGETEKNLARVFEEAADSDAVLFFDEADAVFGKRSEVKDSHDRYANIEVGYLLQRIEEHDGIVVLATNLRANIDDAFLRRMRSVIEFPFPEEDDRRRIWERTLGRAPLQADVDLAFMASQFRVAGGNIRNIVLLAAFLAASEGSLIGMRHLATAAKREYQKLGRLVSTTESE